MKSGAQIAAAAAGGYLLGRFRKRKWILLLGGMAAGRMFGTSPGQLVEQGTKSLGSPELSKLTRTVGGPLVDAGKAAAIKAASTQMESLTDRLNERAESLRQPGAAAEEEAPEGRETAEEPEPAAEAEPRRRGTSGDGRRAAAGRSRTSRTASADRTRETSSTTRARTRGSSGSGARQRTGRTEGQAPRRQQRRSSGSGGSSARRREGDGDG